MSKVLIGSALLALSINAIAEPYSEKREIASDQSKGTVMAITDRGPQAVDAAHLLAIQAILHPGYKPQFLALEKVELSDIEEKYHLTKADLPVFIFVNTQGAEINRIVAGPLTAVGRYVANNSAIVE